MHVHNCFYIEIQLTDEKKKRKRVQHSHIGDRRFNTSWPARNKLEIKIGVEETTN